MSDPAVSTASEMTLCDHILTSMFLAKGYMLVVGGSNAQLGTSGVDQVAMHDSLDCLQVDGFVASCRRPSHEREYRLTDKGRGRAAQLLANSPTDDERTTAQTFAATTTV